MLAIKFDLIQYLQVLSINKPTDRELTLVLDALDEYLKVESTIKMEVYEGVNEDVEEIITLFFGENDKKEKSENSAANTTVEENNATVPQADPGE